MLSHAKIKLFLVFSLQNAESRANLDYAILLKVYMYSLYYDVRIRKIEEHYSLGSELNYLSLGIHHFPKRTVFS